MCARVRGLLRVTVAAVVVLSVAGCSGGAPDATGVGTVATTTTPSVEASATPTATAEVTPTINPETQGLMNAYEAMSVEEFNQEPQAKRLEYAYYIFAGLANTGDLGDFLSLPLKDGKSIADHNPMLKGAAPFTKLTSGTDIQNLVAFVDSVSAAYKVDIHNFGDGTLDKVMADKLISAITDKVGAADKSGKYKFLTGMNASNLQARQLVDYDKTVVYATSDVKEGVDAAGEPLTSKSVVYGTGTGNEISKATYAFRTFTIVTGAKMSTWTLMNDIKVTSLDANK